MPKIIFFGSPRFSAVILDNLIKNNYKPVLVVTSPDKRNSRSGQKSPTPVKELAKHHNIPTKTYGSLRDRQDVIDELKSYDPDLIIVAAYGKIIPQNILSIPKIYPLNIHGSVLPLLRGASPVQTAILNGLTETGVTLMVMNEKMDEGDILKIKKVPIKPTDTSEDLFIKMSQIASDLLINSMKDILANRLTPQKQNHSKATYTKLIKKEDGFFNIASPPKNLGNMIKAYHPWPGVTTEVDGKIIKFLPDKYLQLPSKKPISLNDFRNGYPKLAQKLEKILENI